MSSIPMINGSSSVDNLQFSNIAYSSNSNSNSHHTSKVTSNQYEDNNKINNTASSLLPTSSLSSSSATGFLSFLSLDYYAPYFAVTTVEMQRRLLLALTPTAAVPFYSDIEGDDKNIDMYGPWWITTTLIVIIGAAGNFSSWLAFEAAQAAAAAAATVPSTATTTSWSYDFSIVTFTSSLLYTYLFLVPVAYWFAVRKIASVNDMSLPEVMSIVGYSLVFFIPTSLVAIINIAVLRWLLFAACCGLSSTFMVRNLWLHKAEHRYNKAIVPVVGAMVALQVLLTVAIRVWCFTD